MKIKAYESKLNGVWVIEPVLYGDSRGYFYESFNQKSLQAEIGLDFNFVQDNHSKSLKNVLSGIHYQISKPQGKLIRVVEGEIFDVAVDIRIGSPNFGSWFGINLSAENRKQLWVPPDFAHGFLVVSEKAQVLYKTTDFYDPELERVISWNDKTIGIEWPLNSSNPILSNKDTNSTKFTKLDLPYYKKK